MNQDHVLAAWVQGEDDPAALRDLQRWLQEDPQHRHWARDELALHLALRAHLQPADAAAVAKLVDEVGVGRAGARTTQRHRITRDCLAEVAKRRRRGLMLTMISLAAGLLLVIGMVTLTTTTPDNLMIAQPEKSIGRITALSGVGDIERSGVRRRLVAGEALFAKDRLIAGTGSRIAWQDDRADLELHAGDCLLPPQPDAEIAIGAGLLRVATRPGASSAVRLIAAAATIETSDAILRVAIASGGTHLDVERGQAVIAHAGMRQVVTPARAAFNDASGSYRVLFHFSQSGPERDPRVAYGDPQADPTAPDGWSLHGVMLDGAREVYFDGGLVELLTLESGAELRITYRITGHGPLRVFAHNQDEHADITAELGQVTGPAWHTAVIRGSDFHRQGQQFDQPGAFPGNRLRNLIIASDRPTTVTDVQVDDVLYVVPAPARP